MSELVCETDTISLSEMASEILLNILKYLSVPDLLNMKLTCRRFCCVINSFWDQIVFKHPLSLLVTNQSSRQMQKRCQNILVSFTKHRISNNWQRGTYKETSQFFKQKCIPCFHLEKDRFWLGRGTYIKSYARYRGNVDFDYPNNVIDRLISKHLCKFVVNDDLILSGNGPNLRLHSLQSKKCIFNFNLNDMEINCLDLASNCFAVGSRDCKLQFYDLVQKKYPIWKFTNCYEDRIWSVALNHRKLAIGTAANKSSTSLIVLDIERRECEMKLGTQQIGAGILNCKWENPDLLWTGGYDSFLRKWDLRIGECVQSFLDPFMSTIYSFDYDFTNTMVTGCDSNGRVVLWDIRKDKYIQMYYMKSCTTSSSPVYCISFDAEYLFAATESHVNVLDFTLMRGPVQDYSEIFKHQIII